MTSLDQRDEVREHQRRRIRALEAQVDGLEQHRQRLELTAGLLALTLARGDESLSAALVEVAEATAVEVLAAREEPGERLLTRSTLTPEILSLLGPTV